MSVSLPVRLRSLRAARGWTLEEAAEEVGINPDNLSKLERGFRKPRVGTLAKIANAYGVPVEGLMEAEETVPLGKADPLAGAGGSEAKYTKSSDLASLLYALGSETAHLADPDIVEKVEEAPVHQLFNLLSELDEEIELLTPELARLRQEVKSKGPGFLKFSRVWSESAERFLGLKMALRSRLEVEPEEEVHKRIEDFIGAVP